MSTTEAEMSRDELLEELQFRKKQLHAVDGERLRLSYALKNLHTELLDLRDMAEDMRERINSIAHDTYRDIKAEATP
jgi:hypothetical protein